MQKLKIPNKFACIDAQLFLQSYKTQQNGLIIIAKDSRIVIFMFQNNAKICSIYVWMLLEENQVRLVSVFFVLAILWSWIKFLWTFSYSNFVKILEKQKVSIKISNFQYLNHIALVSA